ncbi:MAG: hypothetical protein A2070_04555 [Bdellovibrionales bacterium GWC1_52_8]|nr:MAG: hypothetical protein A2X97_09295 [Bdellovibrionales bacterium GWA1_52_35]OFZ39847.1 MAG: hypothetical protein A2070_04555 [Bdellovibrionales bacterium GWC1_52_8]
MLQTSWYQYFESLLLYSPFKAGLELILYPLAAIAIYAVKGWSYPVFLLILASDSYLKFEGWQDFPEAFTFELFFATLAVNAVIVGYFLIPTVRAAYFDKRLRWWESKPRYRVKLRGLIKTEQLTARCTALNISEGGVFIKASHVLEPGSALNIELLIMGKKLLLSAVVIYARTGEPSCYGLKFRHTRKTQYQLKRITAALSLMGLKSRNINPKWWVSLWDWAATLFQTGRGIQPEAPQLRK